MVESYIGLYDDSVDVTHNIFLPFEGVSNTYSTSDDPKFLGVDLTNMFNENVPKCYATLE